MGTGSPIPRAKTWRGRDVDHSPPSSAEVEAVLWRIWKSSPYVLLAKFFFKRHLVHLKCGIQFSPLHDTTYSALHFSETSVCTFDSIWRHKPQHCHPHLRGNLKHHTHIYCYKERARNRDSLLRTQWIPFGSALRRTLVEYVNVSASRLASVYLEERFH
jgi:hypothetical protein